MSAADGLIALTDKNDIAGAIVYWSLSGVVQLADVVKKFGDDFIDDRYLPWAPSLETVIYRAAQNCVKVHQLIRPIKRGESWAVVAEKVDHTVERENGAKHGAKLEYDTLVRFWIERGDDESEVPMAVPEEPDSALCTELAAAIKDRYSKNLTVLNTSDVSSWLLESAVKMHGVSLRDRGGVYFIPRDRLDQWREITRALVEVSDHRVYEIPALKSAQAVEAILEGVRDESRAQFAKLDEYLSGEVSTRGLNSWETQLETMRTKVAHYVELLGEALPDLESRFTNLTGALQAARLSHEEKARGK